MAGIPVKQPNVNVNEMKVSMELNIIQYESGSDGQRSLCEATWPIDW